MLPFHLSQGLSKFWLLPLNEQFFIDNICKGLHLKQNWFFSLFKGKNWRETKQNIFPLQIKNHLPFFGEKILKQILI